MRYIADNFIKIAKELSISLLEIPSNEAKLIRERVEEKYAKKGAAALWERISDCTNGAHFPGEDTIIRNFDLNKIIVFFEEDEDKTFFEIDNTNDFARIIFEMFGFTYYVTNEQINFLLCWNDHEYLIGAGDGKMWVEELMKERATRKDL